MFPHENVRAFSLWVTEGVGKEIPKMADNIEDDYARRREQRNDPRYVSVKGGTTDEQRYLVQIHKPNLVGAYQTARLPDHIHIGQINAEGFTATEEEASKVWAYLEQWDSERKAAMRSPEAGRIAQPNAVLERELTQQKLGNVPPGSKIADAGEIQRATTARTAPPWQTPQPQPSQGAQAGQQPSQIPSGTPRPAGEAEHE